MRKYFPYLLLGCIYPMLMVIISSTIESVNNKIVMFVGCLLYFSSAYWLVRKKAFAEKWRIALLFALPYFLLATVAIFFFGGYTPFFLLPLSFLASSLLAAIVPPLRTIVAQAAVVALFVCGVFLFSSYTFPKAQRWYERHYGAASKGGTLGTTGTIGQQPLNFLLPGDKPVNSESWLGKTVVLDFWATYCGPCIEKFPAFEQTALKYRNDTTILFYGVGLPVDNQSPEDVQAFFNKYNLSYTTLTGSDALAKRLGIKGIPRYIIIDKKGYIRYNGLIVADSPAEWPNKLNELIDQNR
jgi:thiol-disulfide isomerase/thioredoxin